MKTYTKPSNRKKTNRGQEKPVYISRPWSNARFWLHTLCSILRIQETAHFKFLRLCYSLASAGCAKRKQLVQRLRIYRCCNLVHFLTLIHRPAGSNFRPGGSRCWKCCRGCSSVHFLRFRCVDPAGLDAASIVLAVVWCVCETASSQPGGSRLPLGGQNLRPGGSRQWNWSKY